MNVAIPGDVKVEENELGKIVKLKSNAYVRKG